MFIVYIQYINYVFIVDAVWAEWGEWESCSVSCGGATQNRSRECIWPDENNKGDYCIDDGSNGMQSRKCGESRCPGKQQI